ncbi:hypothetical protein J7E38_00100 [Bacillus sp. ISL-35]|uniref:hypothetical protein n=1 Tax=Bacillus sp. ISL-35 TaxID=2819122 RepID=UPI001BE6C018|nr:hypothetical protein [Bacillus sp. ISL-35]MBT2677376.1 hypothetical protein [Bacillus sp. ISL-35]MBT2702237.1 hypothetical protein [Chryseobacterium sp. ISL-80]
MNNKKKKRGRPSSERNKNEVEEIIKRYLKEFSNIHEIRPYAVFTFAESIKSELEGEYASSFWRSKGQMGRDLIDHWNDTLKASKESEKNQKRGFYNTEALLQSGDGILTKAIIKKLKLNESTGKYYEGQTEKLGKQNKELKERLAEVENLLNQKQIEVERLEEALFDVTLASTKKRSKIENILDVGEERSPMVVSLLKYSLGDIKPEFFDNWLRGKSGSEQAANSNIINLQEKKQQSAFDDFSF